MMLKLKQIENAIYDKNITSRPELWATRLLHNNDSEMHKWLLQYSINFVESLPVFFRSVNMCHRLNSSFQQTCPDVQFLVINCHFLVQVQRQLCGILAQPHRHGHRETTKQTPHAVHIWAQGTDSTRKTDKLGKSTKSIHPLNFQLCQTVPSFYLSFQVLFS